MKGTGIIRAGICMAVFCLLALHCANPFIPSVQIVSPEADAVFVEDAPPYAMDVEVSVPLPGCGATTYPVDTGSFSATLVRLLDGEVQSQTPIDMGDPVLDPDTGTNTWTGTVGLASFGDYSVEATISNDQGQVTRTRSVRLEQTVALLPAQAPEMTISSLGQNPKNCLLPNPLLSIINGLIGDLFFYMFIPSGADILAATPPGYTVTLDLPVLGGVDVVLTLDEVNNDILMDGPDDYTIDLTGLAPPPLTGFDCVITGAADGAFDDTDPGDMDGFLTVSILDVQPSPGGTCVINPPTGACDMIVGLDGDP